MAHFEAALRKKEHYQDRPKFIYVTAVVNERIELRDLPERPRIEYEMDTLMKVMIDNWWSGTFTKPTLIGMEVDKGDTCREMVINGLGYGILSSALVEDVPDLHRINIHDGKGEPIARQTWLMYHEHSLELKLVNQFVEFVKTIDFKRNI